ncbi:MAG: aminotransferase class I/II-fold pyridoxal phosphate-dependent enzyme [Acidimicrobiales bacterium]
MSLAPGPHGGDGAAVARALGVAVGEVLDLSMSLNPAATDPMPILAAHLEALGRYPDAHDAHRALARALDVAPERLLVTNGGAEAIALVAAARGGSVIEPEFALHPRGTGPRWRSNPHNPTGLLAGPDERADVWDEAFYPLATGRWTRGDADCVVVGSLTKLLACPGLRVGYVLADADLIAELGRSQPAWSLNSLACAALPDLLATVDLTRSAAAVAEGRAALTALLAAGGFAVRPSQANWVLVDRPGLRDELLGARILVRDCASFGLPGTVRIAVPPPLGLERLARALARIDPAAPASPNTEEDS